MATMQLVWISNSPEWEDVQLEASLLARDAERLRLAFRGETDEGGHYGGEIELALRDGVQSLEGEYSVHPPADSPEPFTQVVAFGLTGQLKTCEDGLTYFSGIWDESGVAQAFRIGPLDDQAESASDAPRSAQPGGVQADFAAALAAYALLLPELHNLAAWQQRLIDLNALLAHVAERQAHADAALADWLREEASGQLEALLDEPVALPGGTPAELRRLADNLAEALRRYGYPLCAAWLGLTEQDA